MQKNKGYFAKKYLSTYQINRVDYNFYGGTKKLNGDQAGMLLALLIISGITVQQIMLHMKDCFVEFKKIVYNIFLVYHHLLFLFDKH